MMQLSFLFEARFSKNNDLDKIETAALLYGLNQGKIVYRDHCLMKKIIIMTTAHLQKLKMKVHCNKIIFLQF